MAGNAPGCYAYLVVRKLTHQPGPIRGLRYHPTTGRQSLRRGSPRKSTTQRPQPGPFKWRPHPGRRQGGTRSLAGCGGGGLPALGRTPHGDSDQSQARDESRATAGRGAESGKSPRAAVRVTAGLNPGLSVYSRDPAREEPRPARRSPGRLIQPKGQSGGDLRYTEPPLTEPPHGP